MLHCLSFAVVTPPTAVVVDDVDPLQVCVDDCVSRFSLKYRVTSVYS